MLSFFHSNSLWGRVVLAGLILVSAMAAHGQGPAAGAGWCGFDRVQADAFAHQPGAEAAYRQFLAQAARLAAAQPRGPLAAAPDVTVPVVVHLVFSSVGGTPTGISDAQVADALRILNLDFSKTNPDTAAIIPAFVGRAANVGFRFRLAKIDPTGNCTTGITRHLSWNGSASSDEQLKREVHWDPARYLNIWVVDGIGTGLGGVLGYAYLPCTGGPLDGVVILKRQFGTIGSASGNTSPRALSHEVGHYFGLNHTWGPTNDAGLPGNCATDDGIADTPNTIGTYACNLAFTSCTDPATNQPILANVQNYMDYAACPNMFTTGQRAVMRAALALGCRGALTTAANLLATGTNDGYQPPAGGCPLTVSIGVDQRQVCANQSGGPRYFSGFGSSDALNAAGAAVQWAFPGGVPASSTSRIERVGYPTPGIYPVTLTITPAGGPPVTRTEPNWMQVGGAGTGLAGPLSESFESPGFPNNFGPADLRSWVPDTLRRPPAFRWQRRSGGPLVAANGAACLTVPNNPVDGTSPTFTAIVSPALDLSTLKGPGRAAQLTFRTAWARHPTAIYSGNDELLVQYGTDCEVYANVTGQTFYSSQLQPPGQAAQAGFVPTSAQQWATLTLPLNPQYIGPATWVRFQFKSSGGNSFYLDQVRIQDPAVTATAAEARARRAIAVYPNPLTAETAVHFTLATPETAAVQLTDLLGRPVAQGPARAYGAGPQAVRMPVAGGASLAAGVYLVRLTLGEQVFTTRVLVD